MDWDETGELIQRARQGDEAAMERLVALHADRLKRFIREELGDRLRRRMESRDVMQQVCLDAIRGLDRFTDRGPDSFYAWLRTIALNRIRDEDRKAFQTKKRAGAGEMRSADLARDGSMAGLLDRLSGSFTTPSRAADRADRVRLLEAALARLAPDRREVIRLRYLQQRSVAETAGIMGRSEQAVRSLCVRALIHLRELLADKL